MRQLGLMKKGLPGLYAEELNKCAMTKGPNSYHWAKDFTEEDLMQIATSQSLFRTTKYSCRC